MDYVCVMKESRKELIKELHDKGSVIMAWKIEKELGKKIIG